jgi:hypothetical protein
MLTAMTEKKLRESFKKMLSDCPAVISPSKEIKGAPVGRSKIYQALRNGEIEHFVCKRGYFFTKDAFIDYLVKTATAKGSSFKKRDEDQC